MFGKTPIKKKYYLYFRVLETNDEYFDYFRKRHAFWKMYGLGLPDEVLEKIYYENAMNLFFSFNFKKTNITMKIILLLLITTNLSFSQGLSGVENFILASDEDKDLLANNYFNPLFKSMQISMSEGWARTAKTHKNLDLMLPFCFRHISS